MRAHVRSGCTSVPGGLPQVADVDDLLAQWRQGDRDEFELASASGIPTTVTARRIGDDMPNGKPYSGDEEPEISPGRRADLLLVDGDLTRNISATRSIRGVWIDGTKVAGAR
jgi:hypothetical protein